MNYRMSLHDRLRQATSKRSRYWRDPQYRLACINRSRARAGIPPLDELPDTGPLVARGERGRFERA